jgi:predicted anti-sigma-YlaC factor YlaD
MTPEPPRQDCESFQPELTRLACGDAAEPTPALRTHLENCPACRSALTAARRLVSDLRVALQPAELPATVLTSIERRLRALPAHGRRTRYLALLVPCAVAASVALALLVSSRPHGPAQRPTTAGTQTARQTEDSAWDSPAGYALDTLKSGSADTSAGWGTSGDAWTLLPWGTEDDWDVPPGSVESG